MKIALIVGLWAACSFGTAGAINADFRGTFADFSYYCKSTDGRSNLARAFGISLIPITWIMSPFLTGFYQHGWTMEHGSWGKCKQREESGRRDG